MGLYEPILHVQHVRCFSRKTHRLLLVGFLAGGLLATATAAPPSVSFIRQDTDGIALKVASGTLKLRVFSPRTIEVVFALGDALPQPQSLSVIASPQPTKWQVAETPEQVFLRTEDLEVRVSRASGAVGFYDKTGQCLLRERTPDGKSLIPSRAGNLDTLQSQQVFELSSDEAIYGLGQHPDAPMNYRGAKVHLQQENRIVAVPVLVSNRGYGVLWDNPAVTDVDVGAMDKGLLSWKSEAADSIDYYFMYGPELDRVVASYRELTGAAPMFPKWAWGFWQCRERYETQNELLSVVSEYRKRHIPLDGIIQDWQYWQPGGWGSHEFDGKRFPDPAGMVKTIHEAGAHIIISIWPRFDPGLANLAKLENAGAAFPPVYSNVYPPGKGKWYDPFKPEGRRLYWQFLSERLLARGFDGWWMDASEAELGGHWGEMRDLSTGAGPGAKVFNAYPLEHTMSVYQGQRAENPDKRVFILTRSAFTGQQRNAAVTWSGDTTGTWEIFQHQIPAGLNFVATGIPYWNTDIGAFFGGDPADPGYAELFTRWFQYGALCPMFRVHGTGKPKEVWRFDAATQRILTGFIQLRYHLLPYIYSVAWRVTSANDTMMRPLVMDFRGDANVLGIPDQFMFGPAFMACPVTKPGAANRSVYLPAAAAWFDFWSGAALPGGQRVMAKSPIETMPLYVRAGSILPYGPVIESAAQKPDPLELRVYRGANGSFTLYEDEGDNYNYERGVHAAIPITWNEAQKTLTLGRREGCFPGMLKERTFHVAWVSAGHGAGIAPEEHPDATVSYTGETVTVHCVK
jgi:alpha-D-xyloside xylohydrolase